MSRSITELPLDGPLFAGAIEVYGDAFIRPPYRDPDRGRDVRERLLTVHRHRRGYRGLLALDDGRPIGIAYAYHSAPGQWWHDAVAATIGHQATKEWLANACELVEIAVAPGCQGQGVGSALIAELLKDRTEARCVLSTRVDSDAHHLYRRLGFEVIQAMPFAPGGALFYVMGKRLQ